MNVMSSKFAPTAIGPYSQAVEHRGFIFMSGMLPIDPETNQLASLNIQEQTEQVLANIKNFLNDQGLEMNQVIKTVMYITSMADFQVVNDIYASYFTTHRPARSCLEVSALPKGALIEIEAVVAKE
ncbi:Rid family detoxifying hydrolase [Siminovitchia sp. FSL W7-1587]|uniref:Rid family detoxifying hydrolase n=1 Tax=Siminovitchia sp. FSL W7-1587 TaxID=2954699 RepID=UPI0030CF90BB